MPRVPQRTSFDRIAPPAVIDQTNPEALRAEGVAKGAEKIASATAGVFQKLAQARNDAAANEALTQGFSVMNRAQETANKSNDYASMSGSFTLAYDDALPKILESLPDDGTRAAVQTRLEQSFLTRRASVNQRALVLEREDQRAKLARLGKAVTRMAVNFPNSLTLGNDVQSYFDQVENGLRHDNLSAEEANGLKQGML